MAVAAPVRVFLKPAASILDYYFDWSDWLGPLDAILTSAWAATTIVVASQTWAASLVTVWISGGATGTSYDITNTITTTGGRTESRSFRIVVVDR